MATEPLLRAEGLDVVFPGPDGTRRKVLDGVSLSVGAGERVGLVGSSGSGKSMTALAILDLVPEPGQRCGGRVFVDGADAASVDGFRGGVVGLVLQEAASALNPVFSVAGQLVETLAEHGVAKGADARQRAHALLREAAIEDVESVAKAYPHQLSGGQAQRVMIALALAGDPRVILADEPTTALDAVTQARILELLVRITDERGLGLLLVSHDLAVMADLVHRVVVIDGGRVVEEGTPAELIGDPHHPATRRIVQAAVELASVEGWS